MGLRPAHATLMLGLGIAPQVVQGRLARSNIPTKMNIYSDVTPTPRRALGGTMNTQENN